LEQRKNGKENNFHHVSVLLEQCITGLNVRPDGIYVDGTLGGAGHSLEITKRLTTGRLIGIDKDKQALEAAGRKLEPYVQAQIVQGDFRDIPEILERLQIPAVDGILLDLGVSSYQLDTPERGFSYHHDAPLDMRMSDSGKSAYDVIAGYTADELTKIFYTFGEEKFARKIAANIVATRSQRPIETTGQLVEIIKASIPAAARREGGHPAKRVFQAIRIEVNEELESLRQCLDTAFDCLRPGGRFAVITFHSLEDRMVKQAFAGYARGCTCPPDFPVCVCGKKPRGKQISRKPILPSREELEQNNRSRSAKLRIIEKL